MSSAKFGQISATYLENWPPELVERAIPHKSFPLIEDESRVLAALAKGRPLHNASTTRAILSGLTERLEQAIRCHPQGAFVRLGSRSGKDSLWSSRFGLKVTNATMAITATFLDSPRVAHDLDLAIHHQYQPHVFVREWMDFPKLCEFRCFMQQRKLVGISQYYTSLRDDSRELLASKNQIEASIQSFFESFREIVHLDNIVFDVIVRWDQITTINQQSPKVILLDLNPFGAQSDPCLFSWDRPREFDGSFRIRH